MNPLSTADLNQVRLLVDGAEYAGWKAVRISAGIERQARDFTLEVTDRWPGQTDVPRRISAGDACQVFIGPDLVLTGHVDATPIRYDGRSVSVTVQGRSKTADLVDCSPLQPGQAVGASAGLWADVTPLKGPAPKPVAAPKTAAGQWRNQRLEVIAAALAAPYGVQVIAQADTGRPITDHQVQVGESVFESIDRMMRARHVLSTDNERGDLVFVSVGSGGRASTEIFTGKNVLVCSSDLDYKDVYTTYIVKGQRAGTDDEFAAQVAESLGSASGPVARLRRRRILVIKQGGQVDSGTAQERADYERAHRAAAATQAAYAVNGWRQDDGSLWQPNLLVRVRDAVIGIDAERLISEVSYVMDSNGLRAEMKVADPAGFLSKAEKSKKKSGTGAQSWSDVQ